MTKKREDFGSNFSVKTKIGLGIIVFLGLIIFYLSYHQYVQSNDILKELLRYGGQTLISAGLVSVILELHTIQNGYIKVRDCLFLEKPSFIERYNENEIDKLIDYAIVRKIQICSNNKNIDENFQQCLIGQDSIIQPFIKYTAQLLGKEGIYCSSHRRQINIDPKHNTEYNINITVEVEFVNFSNQECSFKEEYKFYYISRKQIDSFLLLSLEIDGKNQSLENIKIIRNTDEKKSTSKHPFNYYVSFEIPLTIQANSSVNYTLNYTYSNFEQACYITYSLPHITKSFQETYSLTGECANEYQIHASAYTPYKREIDTRPMVQRRNENTLSINWENWFVPGSGFVAIVRKKIPGTIDTAGTKMH